MRFTAAKVMGKSPASTTTPTPTIGSRSGFSAFERRCRRHPRQRGTFPIPSTPYLQGLSPMGETWRHGSERDMRQCDPQHVHSPGRLAPTRRIPAALASRRQRAARARLFRFLIGSTTVLRQTTFRYLLHAAKECYSPHSTAQSWDSPLTDGVRSKRT